MRCQQGRRYAAPWRSRRKVLSKSKGRGSIFLSFPFRIYITCASWTPHIVKRAEYSVVTLVPWGCRLETGACRSCNCRQLRLQKPKIKLSYLLFYPDSECRLGYLECWERQIRRGEKRISGSEDLRNREDLSWAK